MEKIPITPVSHIKNSVELGEDFEEVLQNSLRELFSYESEEHFIDKGGIGKVYELPKSFCIKILDDRHSSPHSDKFDLGNRPDEEVRFQEQMAVCQYQGKTRVPSVIGTVSLKNPETRTAIIMERLDAVNLQHVINALQGKDNDLPKNFDLESVVQKLDLNSFFEDLELFVNHMHSEERIIHGDLYPRNIMTDLETGDPRVIDFGRAEKLPSGESEQEKKKIEEDWRRINEAYELLYSLTKQ